MKHLGILLILFGILVLQTSSFGQKKSMVVITYNIRYDNPRDGINAWPKRKERVVNLIKSYKPAIVCLQEVINSQFEYLKTEMPNYEAIGVGRDDGKTEGEYSPLFYDKSKFTLIQWKTIWLSNTPEVAGSKGWDADLPRVATIALLRETKSGKLLLAASTHFDHVGVTARLESAKLLQATLVKLQTEWKPEFYEGKIAMVVGGDLNAEPGAGVVEAFQKDDLLKAAPNKEATFRTFKLDGAKKIIDYLFFSNDFKVDITAVDTASKDGYYPSDHCLVYSVIHWK
jgi:endonuclease/exonuclease/phosphatase family metal-dependent hydrolase